MSKRYIFIICFILAGIFEIHAQITVAEPVRTFQSAMRRFTEIFQMVNVQDYNSASIKIKVAYAEELFSNNTDRYLIVAFPAPESNSYAITVFFRDAQIALAIIFDKSNFGYKLPDQLNEVYKLYQDIGIILWQSSGD